MAIDREKLLKRLQESFRVEAGERLPEAASLLRSITSEGPASVYIDALFREIHSLKGASRAAGLTHIEKLCHHWEQLLSVARKDPDALTARNIELSEKALHILEQDQQGKSLTAEIVEEFATLFHRAALGEHLDSISLTASVGKALSDEKEAVKQKQSRKEDEKSFSEGQKALSGEQKAFSEEQKALNNTPESSDSEPSAIDEKPATDQKHAQKRSTVRVRNEQLDTLLFINDELQQSVSQLTEQHQHIRKLEELLRSQRKRHITAEHQIKLMTSKLDSLPVAERTLFEDVIHYIEWSHARFDEVMQHTQSLVRSSGTIAQQMEHHTGDVRTELENALLLPASQLLETAYLHIRELSEATGKRVKLETSGGELQIDKRIIDSLEPVMTHLLRNAVDHGIEDPNVRQAAGKPRTGAIKLTIYQESGGRAEIVMADDGGGIDLERIRQKAVELELYDDKHAKQLTEDDLKQLIFLSGISTSLMLTEISGRGVGMNVVQDTIERLGGSIYVSSTSERGTEFRLNIPVNLSNYRALIVSCDQFRFAIPAISVVACIQYDTDQIKAIDERPTVLYKEQSLPLWDLNQLLELPVGEQPEQIPLIVLESRDELFALKADEIAGDEVVTVKETGPLLSTITLFAGAAIAANGKLIPVLNPAELQRIGLQSAGVNLMQRPQKKEKVRVQRILVADDSFTSRGLLRSILESAGYEVVTVNDGSEAWHKLKQESFDLLVSDIEMPRMDGFVLTTKVRGDAELKSLPVVLVTALQSPEDQTRGLESGANAYLVKSGFEQDNLLDSVRRLI